MRPAVWLGLAIGLAIGGDAGAADPLEGVFSNVCADLDAGEQDGFEVQVARGAAGPAVRFTVCDHACETYATRAVTAAGATIRFTAVEGPVGSGGKPGTRVLVGRAGPKALVLSSPEAGFPTLTLNRQGDPPRVDAPRAHGFEVRTWPKPYLECGPRTP